jgi:hypothetical protein
MLCHSNTPCVTVPAIVDWDWEDKTALILQIVTIRLGDIQFFLTCTKLMRAVDLPNRGTLRFVVAVTIVGTIILGILSNHSQLGSDDFRPVRIEVASRDDDIANASPPLHVDGKLEGGSSANALPRNVKEIVDISVDGSSTIGQSFAVVQRADVAKLNENDFGSESARASIPEEDFTKHDDDPGSSAVTLELSNSELLPSPNTNKTSSESGADPNGQSIHSSPSPIPSHPAPSALVPSMLSFKPAYPLPGNNVRVSRVKPKFSPSVTPNPRRRSPSASPSPIQFSSPKRCTQLRWQLSQDFNHHIVFNESSILETSKLLMPHKMAILHINESGVFLALPPKDDGHSLRCLRGMLKTFRPFWSSPQLRGLLNNRQVAAISILMNFNASEVTITRGAVRPILSYAKSRLSHDMLYPRPYLNENWEKIVPFFVDTKTRKRIAIFRGTLTNPIRAALFEFAKNNSDVVDIGIVQVIKGSSLEETGKNISLTRWADLMAQTRNFRYIINVDGWGCADRLPYLLKLNSVILYHGASKEDPNECVEWYHGGLKAGENFVKFNPDLSDLREKIEWLRDHERDSTRIVSNANFFSKSMIALECANWYFWEVLKRYGRIYQPTGQRTDAEQWIERSKILTRVVPLAAVSYLKG